MSRECRDCCPNGDFHSKLCEVSCCDVKVKTHDNDTSKSKCLSLAGLDSPLAERGDLSDCGKAAAMKTVEAAVAAFEGDTSRTSLALPPILDVNLRAQVKALVAEYPGLSCQSFGFGAERYLHLFRERVSEPECEPFACGQASYRTCVPLSPGSSEITFGPRTIDSEEMLGRVPGRDSASDAEAYSSSVRASLASPSTSQAIDHVWEATKLGEAALPRFGSSPPLL